MLGGLVQDAHAFIPMGGFNISKQLVFTRWSWPAMMDRNNDGDISGPDEGIPLLLEGGRNGWTDNEITIVKESFQVWQDVPTSYVGFQFLGVNQDPIPIGSPNDLINYVSIEVPNDIIKLPLATGVIGETIVTAPIDDGFFPDTGPVQVYHTGGEFIEADIVINGTLVRSAAPGVKPQADLKAALVHEIGHFVGLGHTPLNNLEIVATGAVTGPVESPVFAQRDATGLLKLVGVTPTMFPLEFFADNGGGQFTDGGADLAPDDIAGVSFLYPRGSQGNFFSISQEARTLTRPNLPSIPKAGGHIVAWCDVDNDPDTARAPLVSTLSGLYEYQPLLGGRFNLMGLLKVIETMGSEQPFQATYTLTISPLNDLSYERQAPFTGYPPTEYMGSIQGNVTMLTPLWPSEVFHEKGNLLGTENHDVGTPLVFDSTRGAVVSVDSAKTLPTILPGLKPMFGDTNAVCPLNVVIGVPAFTTNRFPTALRGLRDTVLLKTAVGTALVDAYYRVSPALATFLLRHGRVLYGVQLMMRAVEWSFGHSTEVLAVLMGTLGAVAAFLRFKKAFVAAAILLAVCLAALPAAASVLNLSDDDMVQVSDAIITGTVTSANSQWGESAGYKGIVTDVAIEITDSAKGGLNIGSTVNLRVRGGQVGNIATIATESPEFKKDQEVLLYLEYRQDFGYLVVAGRRGKFDVTTDTATGKKLLVGSSPEAKAALAGSPAVKHRSASFKSQLLDDVDTRVPLGDFMRHLREIVKRQK
jgi:hypothetical protein